MPRDREGRDQPALAEIDRPHRRGKASETMLGDATFHRERLVDTVAKTATAQQARC